MNKKLIFRILGAVSSALIIVSLFIPFISVSGYSQSLWEAYSNTNALYLPIMIIVFGAIGVLLFALNIKTEIAYSTAGALLFYLISETVSFIDQDMMKTLSVGYYCLVTGTLLTGIMAFLCNLRTKQKVTNAVQQPENSVSIINQIDALYNNQSENMPMQSQPIQPIPNMPVQPQPIQPMPNIPVQPQPASPIPDMPAQPQPVAPIPDIPAQPQTASPIPDMPAQPQPVAPIPDISTNQINIANENINSSINPVVAEFSASTPSEASSESMTLIEKKDISTQVANPTINEFNTESNTVLPNVPVEVETKVEPTRNNLDIFN